MSRFLDTRGGHTLAIAICDRCRMKKRYDELRPDPNNRGLRVCALCEDDVDPYTLPMRQPESITLRFPRPDVPLSTDEELDIQIGEEVEPEPVAAATTRFGLEGYGTRPGGSYSKG